jgi:hypothetical protein
MNPAVITTAKPGTKAQARPDPLGTGFRGVVRRSALLNLGIAVSALMIGAFAGRLALMLIVFRILPYLSLLLWAATFSLSGFAAILQVFRRENANPLRPLIPYAAPSRGGVPDRWIDGPV